MEHVMEARSEKGYARARNEGEAFWLFGMLQEIKIGREDSAGALGLLEIHVPEGHGSPWHVHLEEDEWFYVLDGALTVWVGDTKAELKPGGFAFGPKGVPHTFYSTAPVTRALVGFAPMQFEGFLRTVGQPAPVRELPPHHDGPPPDIAKLKPIAEANGFVIMGPPGPPPGQ